VGQESTSELLLEDELPTEKVENTLSTSFPSH